MCGQRVARWPLLLTQDGVAVEEVAEVSLGPADVERHLGLGHSEVLGALALGQRALHVHGTLRVRWE